MSDVRGFVEALLASRELREAFVRAPQQTLEAHGLNPDLFEVPECMSLEELEERLAQWHAANSTEDVVPEDAPEAAPPQPADPLAGLPPLTSPEATDWPLTRTVGLGAESAMLQPRRGQVLPLFEGSDVDGSERAPHSPEGPRAEAGALRAEGEEPEVGGGPSQCYPDAWLASHGTATSRALSGQAETRRLIQESIIMTDDRVQIDDPAADPFRWVCSLVVTAANGTRWQGTGWLIGARTLVTAGHNVYMPRQGGWVRSVDVYLADVGGAQRLVGRAHYLHSVTGWVRDGRTEDDYGAITLRDPIDDAGHFGYAAYTDTTLSNLVVNVVGFPTDKPQGTLWGHARLIGGVSPTTLTYENDTYGGMSGAPLIEWNGGDYLAVGIHNYGDYAGNVGTRITPTVFRNIAIWRLQEA